MAFFKLLLLICFLLYSKVYANDQNKPSEKLSPTEFNALVNSAEEGNTESQLYLAFMYFHGKYVPKDNKKAIVLYRKASEGGNKRAQFFLANMLFNGDGVTQDLKEAAYWYQNLSKNGDQYSQLMLGTMYLDGTGVIKNYEKAASLFKQSALQGNSAAQNNLGVLYAHGQGVPQDFVKSYMWGIVAKFNGHDSEHLIATSEKYLVNSKIKYVQEIAQKCIDSNYQNCE